MITQGQFDALVSLAFNAGCSGIRQSEFIQSVKKGDHKKSPFLFIISIYHKTYIGR